MLRNSLGDTLRLHGLHDRTAAVADVAIVLAHGAMRDGSMRPRW